MPKKAHRSKNPGSGVGVATSGKSEHQPGSGGGVATPGKSEHRLGHVGRERDKTSRKPLKSIGNQQNQVSRVPLDPDQQLRGELARNGLFRYSPEGFDDLMLSIGYERVSKAEAKAKNDSKNGSHTADKNRLYSKKKVAYSADFDAHHGNWCVKGFALAKGKWKFSGTYAYVGKGEFVLVKGP